jgi:hypothetical protein
LEKTKPPLKARAYHLNKTEIKPLIFARKTRYPFPDSIIEVN